MKKLFLLIIPFLFISTVKADVIVDIQYGGSNYSEYYYINNITNYTGRYHILGESGSTTLSCDSRISCYDAILSAFASSGKNYYSIRLDIHPNDSPSRIDMHAIFFDFSSTDTYTQQVFSSGGSNVNRFYIYKNNVNNDINIILDGFSDPNYNNFYKFYDSNFNFLNSGDYIFQGFYDNENNDYNNMLQVHDDEPYPKIKNLLQYSSWADYENNHLENYTTVNLDNYEYVILNLKNYSQNNAFQTNLQLKGQIGITPVYNFGQTSKDSITGVQVQDRCNLSYSDYTNYPFYILQSDLQNNAVYYIKSCENNSSFKFDSTVFDITYITQSNLNDPIITINGTTYSTIPYADLPSSATKNEENNYIPGESGSATDTGGLDSAIKSAQSKLSEIWNTFTYFTDFVGQIFTSLPSELSTILISAFVITLVLGIVKIFISN